MPIYEYNCPTCSREFQKLQPMSAYGSNCPVCEQPARRSISVFAAGPRGALDNSAAGPLPPLGGGGCCGGSCGCAR